MNNITIDTDILEAYSPTDQARYEYRVAIAAAQRGKSDNGYKQLRYYTMYRLAQHALSRFPHLNLVECGCWHGHSTLMLTSLMGASRSDARLHVFDSFEGLSEFQAEDMSPLIATPKARAAERVNFKSSVERLRAKVEPFGCVDIHQGWIPQVFDGVDVGALSFASIDVDLYGPTLASLAFVYPRLVTGGAIYFDDYGYRNFPGAKKAVDEYLADVKPALFMKSAAGSAFLVK